MRPTGEGGALFGLSRRLWLSPSRLRGPGLGVQDLGDAVAIHEGEGARDGGEDGGDEEDLVAHQEISRFEKGSVRLSVGTKKEGEPSGCVSCTDQHV